MLELRLEVDRMLDYLKNKPKAEVEKPREPIVIDMTTEEKQEDDD